MLAIAFVRFDTEVTTIPKIDIGYKHHETSISGSANMVDAQQGEQLAVREGVSHYRFMHNAYPFHVSNSKTHGLVRNPS